MKVKESKKGRGQETDCVKESQRESERESKIETKRKEERERVW